LNLNSGISVRYTYPVHVTGSQLIGRFGGRGCPRRVYILDRIGSVSLNYVKKSSQINFVFQSNIHQPNCSILSTLHLITYVQYLWSAVMSSIFNSSHYPIDSLCFSPAISTLLYGLWPGLCVSPSTLAWSRCRSKVSHRLTPCSAPIMHTFSPPLYLVLRYSANKYVSQATLIFSWLTISILIALAHSNIGPRNEVLVLIVHSLSRRMRTKLTTGLWGPRWDKLSLYHCIPFSTTLCYCVCSYSLSL